MRSLIVEMMRRSASYIAKGLKLEGKRERVGMESGLSVQPRSIVD